MKILLLLTDGFGQAGGIAQFNRDLIAGSTLHEAVTSICVIALHGEKKTDLDAHASLATCPIRFQTAVGSKWRMIKMAWQESRTLSTQDLIIVGHLNLMPLAHAIARCRGISTWLVLHGIEAWQRPSRMRAWSANHSDMVTTVSRYTREKFLRWADVPDHRVRVMPNTYRNFFQSSKEKIDLQKKWQFVNRKVLLTVGRLSAQEQYKGHDLVIQCLPNLIKKFPNLLYLIVGTGPDCERLKLLAQYLAVLAHIQFREAKTQQELLECYQLSDVFVMPSKGEGFGIVYLEAMACGLPVVALGIDGSRDALGDGRFGHCVGTESLCEVLAQSLMETDDDTLSPETSMRGAETFSRPNFNHALYQFLDRMYKYIRDKNAKVEKSQPLEIGQMH